MFESRSSRVVLVGLLAGGATLWGVQCARNDDEAETADATTRPAGYHGHGGTYVGGGGGHHSAGVARRGFGSTGGHFSGHS